MIIFVVYQLQKRGDVDGEFREYKVFTFFRRKNKM